MLGAHDSDLLLAQDLAEDRLVDHRAARLALHECDGERQVDRDVPVPVARAPQLLAVLDREQLRSFGVVARVAEHQLTPLLGCARAGLVHALRAGPLQHGVEDRVRRKVVEDLPRVHDDRLLLADRDVREQLAVLASEPLQEVELLRLEAVLDEGLVDQHAGDHDVDVEAADQLGLRDAERFARLGVFLVVLPSDPGLVIDEPVAEELLDQLGADDAADAASP